MAQNNTTQEETIYISSSMQQIKEQVFVVQVLGPRFPLLSFMEILRELPVHQGHYTVIRCYTYLETVQLGHY
ncbi:hypothetical protein Z043_122349 [Scleropages formosus]|uniref:Uncharacterized protein n=1 Tax=Scleropages formosus TaxID=113540 RepID=A0A0P7WEQ3_SCLFO|nr:hypothetical protein Z043_122349 [Scleropages formosus]